MKMIITIIPTDLVTNSLFSNSFCPFLQTENKNQDLGKLVVTRNISVFCLWRVALFFKTMPNSIDFYKGIFLHVFPVRIIVPCSIAEPMTE